ncbi:hypothetical protein PsYK624_068110 [Phanerochaete sordida]|uniref:BTB domain-containing protein n=1 Tax=Phanerochaete sordida TaxID=48140 RepID=A0A9P3G7F9_9APHY|nr:hypothetical protein PsYK624_068110 [Phanerochaete sordida]
MSSPPSSTETAPPSSPTPFPDVPFPDIILQSSGGVEYHMCKRTLAQASPVFADMLSLPQPHSTSAAADEKRDGVSVIALTEPAADLDILLQYCIPQISPTLDDLSTVARLLEGARKYQVDRATKAARTALVCFAQNEPVKAYTVASRYSLEDEVRAAAQCCLRILLESLITASIDDLDGITLQAFRNLLIYRKSCASAVVSRITSWAWIDEYRRKSPADRVLWFQNCYNCDVLVTRKDCFWRAASSKKWWNELMEDIAKRLASHT